MPKRQRNKTKYVGVTYEIHPAKTRSGEEKVYFIRYRKSSKQIEEVAGRQFTDDMTPARAANIRSQKIEGDKPSNTQKRILQAEQNSQLTIESLWDAYQTSRPNGVASPTDTQRWKCYLKKRFGKMPPADLDKMTLDRLRVSLLKKLAPQTVKHILSLLNRIINFGVDQGLVEPLRFKIEFPKVDNLKTEDLTPEQLQRLWTVLHSSERYKTCAQMMKIALYTGMRKSEIFRLQWRDIDALRGFIYIRDPKGGKDQRIPLTPEAQELFESIESTENEEYIFPARDGGPRKEIGKIAREIRDLAGIPADFRPFHGLRHVYATMLACSGKVDMYTLQKLLTHKSPQMTQRYAHLRDETLKQGARVNSEVMAEALKLPEEQTDTE